MNAFRTLISVSLVAVAATSFAKGPGASRRPASANEDGKVMSCTVGFRSKGGVTYHETQKQAWQLYEKKGSIELKSIGDVDVLLSKEQNGKNPIFSLSIKQGKKNLGEIKMEHRSFEYDTDVDVQVKVDADDEGWQADHIRVACDAMTMAG